VRGGVINWRWPKGYVCPVCGRANVSFSAFRRVSLLYRQCRGCPFQCSVIAGAVFEATKLPLTVWFLAMHLLTQAKTGRIRCFQCAALTCVLA